jgi:hypothetical protein
VVYRTALFCTQLLDKIQRYQNFGDIAQLARAPALQAGGPGFESPCLHHNNVTFRAISSVG